MNVHRDNRGVSVAVTHVLTVGITAILISGLLLGSSSMLETQQERSAESALETIGERLASEITSVNQTTSDTVSINTSHQRRVGGSQYTVSLNGSCSTPLIQGNPCLVLESRGKDATVAVPLSENLDVNNSSVTGGAIIIKNEGSGIELRAAQ